MATATGAGGSGGGDDYLARLPNYCESAPVRDGGEEEGEEIERAVRGPTFGIRSERARRPGVKEVVIYNEEFQSFLQPEREMDPDLATFANTLGLVVRDKISPTVPRWTKANVPPAKETEIRAAIRDKYDIRVDGDATGRKKAIVDAAIIRDAKTRLRDWRHTLRSWFDIDCKGSVQVARSLKPKTVKLDTEWETLIERYTSEEFKVIKSFTLNMFLLFYYTIYYLRVRLFILQAMSAKNKANRAKKKTTSRQGTIGFLTHRMKNVSFMFI